MLLPPNGHRLMVAARIILLSFAAIALVLLLIESRSGTPLLTKILEVSCGDMQFVAYNGLNETARGRKFSCSLKPFLDKWMLNESFSYKFKPINASNVVFVTYSSSNHFSEARKGIRSMRSQFKNKIVFYDLGLTKEESTELNNVCNLEVRKLHFHHYPDFVSNVARYNFKGIVMAEVFAEFEHYWMVDTSIRFFNVTPFLNDFYARINSGAIETMVLRHRASHSVFATTDPRMFEYLPMDESLAKSLVMFESGTLFISRGEFSREAVKWNALCALTSDCMAPPGSKVQCNFPLRDRYSTFVNCHRYDQSSINIILSSLLDRDGWNRSRVNDDAMRHFTHALRGDTDNVALSIPCQ